MTIYVISNSEGRIWGAYSNNQIAVSEKNKADKDCEARGSRNLFTINPIELKS